MQPIQVVPIEVVSALVLKYVKLAAEKELAPHRVTRAVITIPAHFSHKQRRATMLAAQLAGLEVGIALTVAPSLSFWCIYVVLVLIYATKWLSCMAAWCYQCIVSVVGCRLSICCRRPPLRHWPTSLPHVTTTYNIMMKRAPSG